MFWSSLAAPPPAPVTRTQIKIETSQTTEGGDFGVQSKIRPPDGNVERLSRDSGRGEGARGAREGRGAGRKIFTLLEIVWLTLSHNQPDKKFVRLSQSNKAQQVLREWKSFLARPETQAVKHKHSY